MAQTATAINPVVRQLMAHKNIMPAVNVDPWRLATAKQQEVALAREAFIRPVLEHIAKGGSMNVIVRNMLTKMEAMHASPTMQQLAGMLGKNGKTPKRSTIINWVNKHQELGVNGLLDQHTGRVRKERGWEALATQMYNIPSKPSYSAVAAKLREDHGHSDATDSAVRRYLKSLPATLGSNSPARVGKHYYHQNLGKFKCRDVSVLEVGEVYEGDGHTVDAYIAHPHHGGPYRPELTVWIDVRSRYIAGWYLSDAESSISTLLALSHALTSHDHVPAWVHIDNGSGYKSKMMSDKSTGFYARFDIQATFAIPGNSRGKGLVEHWFHTFRDHFDKFWNNGQDYCGHDMAQETNRRMNDMIKQGKRKLLSLDEYREGIERFIHTYNHRTTRTLDGQSPADLWQQLKPVHVELPDAAVIRPMQERMVRRCMVSLEGRQYEHRALALFDGQKVRVEYDLHDDSRVWILDQSGRMICDATLKTKVAWMPESRLEEARIKREQGRVNRLQKKIDIVRIEEASLIDHTDTLKQLEAWEADDRELTDVEVENEIKLGILDDSTWGGDE